MNFITSCPACQTQFFLTKDHLKAYRGKVQCGHCSHIFNAKNRLAEVSDDNQNIAAYTAAEYTKDSGADTDFINAPDSDIDIATVKLTARTNDVDEKPIRDVLNVVLDKVPSLSDFSVQNDSNDNLQLANHDTENQITTSTAEVDLDIDAVRAPILIEDLTANPKFQLTKPKRNIWLIIAVLLLIVVALLQSIYFLRSTIAAHYPQFKPYLEQACVQLQCKINLPQYLNLLTIDDSDMQESEDYLGVINFSSLLINNAVHAQAFPNIELTLTDIDDKPVLRKLVRPQEYLSTNINMQTGIAAREEIRIHLVINVQNLSVAGYRVLLTY